MNRNTQKALEQLLACSDPEIATLKKKIAKQERTIQALQIALNTQQELLHSLENGAAAERLTKDREEWQRMAEESELRMLSFLDKLEQHK